MDKFHYSTAECFDNCPYRFVLRYKQGLEVIPTDDPSNALRLGTAFHRGIETDAETAIQEYIDSYNLITDEHINEIIKLEHWIQKAKEILPEGIHEFNFSDNVYEGTADLLVPTSYSMDEKDRICSDCELYGTCHMCESGTCHLGKYSKVYDLYDFKYSNNISNYMRSKQLHVYKHMIERTTGMKIRKMFFVFVPKVSVKQEPNENIIKYRSRISSELNKHEITIKEVQYNPSKVTDFFESCMNIGMTEVFEKKQSFNCKFCEYNDYCQKGCNFMILPKAERKAVDVSPRIKIWIYGSAFSGKTTFADSAPMPLNLNTDGNVKFVTMQSVQIKDTMEGRQKILAWAVFKNTIDELEKTAGTNGFETIVVDLVEDTYESCRLYMYDKLGISHESDDSFRAWDKVRTEYLSTYRRLLNLDYKNIILISHEDTSKDITKKSGDKITAIKPNITDKIASKLAGMVDIVARVVCEDDGHRTLNFKSNEVVFGGGRIQNFSKTTIDLSWDALLEAYRTSGQRSNNEPETVTGEVVKPSEKPSGRSERKSRQTAETPKEESIPDPTSEEWTDITSNTEETAVPEEKKPEETAASGRTRRTRRPRTEEVEDITSDAVPF